MMQTEAICYKWHDTKTNKVYVGCHKLKEHITGFFDDGYISSSKSFNEEYSKRPQDFVRGIYAWGTYDQMLWLETRILHYVDAKRSPWFYNEHNGDGKFVLKFHTEESRKKISIGRKGKHIATGEQNSFFGKHHTEETRKKISEANKGKHLSEETRKKMSEAKKGKQYAKGAVKSKQERDAISERMKGNQYAKGRCHSESTRKKISEALKGRHLSEETRKNMSEAQRRRANINRE